MHVCASLRARVPVCPCARVPVPVLVSARTRGCSGCYRASVGVSPHGVHSPLSHAAVYSCLRHDDVQHLLNVAAH